MRGKVAFNLLFHTSSLIWSSSIPPAEIQTCLKTTLWTCLYLFMLCEISQEVDTSSVAQLWFLIFLAHLEQLQSRVRFTCLEEKKK